MPLPDHSFDNPTIEIVSESPRLEMLQARLRQAGMRPVAITPDQAGGTGAVMLIDLMVYNEAEILSHVAPNRLIVTLGHLSKTHPQPNAIHLSDVNQLATLPARIAIRKREQIRQREALLRLETAQRFGVSANNPVLVPSPKLLWLGSQVAMLNPLRLALKAQGVDLVAALTRLTAEDYLSSGAFSAMVVFPGEAGDPAFQFLQALNPEQLPSQVRLILLSSNETARLLGSDYAEKADHILDMHDDIETLAAQLNSQCNALQQPVSPQGSEPHVIEDKATGLVSRTYLEAHLQGQMNLSDEHGERLSILGLSPTGAVSLKELADVVKPLLRETDLAGRLDSRHLCVSMPSTPYRGAITLAQRIEAMVEGNVVWRVIEKRQFHTLQTLLGGLTAKPRNFIGRRQA